ncbi:MAG: hypothetical protein P8Y07_09975 [Gemmatimonadales bacterium]
MTDRLLAGVELEDGLAAADEARLDSGRGRRGATLQLVLHEGRNREVRRMMKALGVKIRSLTRLSLGPIELGELRPGEWRDLSANEIAALRRDPTE